MTPPLRTINYNGGFKKTLNGTEGRRLREETSIQLRKTKKDEMLRKKRMGLSNQTTTMEGNSMTALAVPQSEIEVQIQDCVQVFQKWCSAPSEFPEDDLVVAVRKIRRLLSVDKNVPVKEVLDNGMLFFLTEMIALRPTDPTLLFEAAWALTNIASTEYTDRVVKHPNTVDRLIVLLRHDGPAVREQSGWCLGNIAGDKIEYRDALLKNPDVTAGLIINLEQPDSSSLLQNVCWTVSNLCRGKPQPPLAVVRPFIVTLYNVIKLSIESFQSSTVENQLHELITDAMWCMTYLSDGDNSRIQVVLDDCDDGDIVDCLKAILKLHKNSEDGIDRSLLIPTVRLIGNIVSGTHDQTQHVVDSGLLKFVAPLLEHPSNALRKEVCWMLSNIAAGTEVQIASLFNSVKHCGLVRSLIKMSTGSEVMTVRKEAAWAICNIITTGNAEQFKLMMRHDAVDPLCDLLTVREDAKLLLIVMEAIEVVLNKNEECGAGYDQLIESYGGLEALENLQDHQSNEVYEKAVRIIERYFGGVEENDPNILPITVGGDSGAATFEFSVPKQLFPDTKNNNESQMFSFGNSANNNFSF